MVGFLSFKIHFSMQPSQNCSNSVAKRCYYGLILIMAVECFGFHLLKGRESFFGDIRKVISIFLALSKMINFINSRDSLFFEDIVCLAGIVFQLRKFWQVRIWKSKESSIWAECVWNLWISTCGNVIEKSTIYITH